MKLEVSCAGSFFESEQTYPRRRSFTETPRILKPTLSPGKASTNKKNELFLNIRKRKIKIIYQQVQYDAFRLIELHPTHSMGQS